MQIGNFKLNMTCGACPEQYDVFLGEVEVGYLRLRHGGFSVDYTYKGCNERVYYANPEGDGIFEEHERHYYLYEAIKAIEKRHFKTQIDKARMAWDS